MARVVKVDLLLEAARYLKGARDAARVTDELSDSVDDAGKAGERAADATEKLGEDLSGLAADARRLDKDIEGTTRGIRELARQIAATSDEAERAKLAEKLDLERGKRRKQVDLRKLLDFNEDEGKEQGIRYGARFSEGLAQGLARAGGPISSALSAVFGGLPPQAQAAIGAGVVAAAASVAPLVGGAVGGAIVGGVGAGGIVGGIAVAARHPAVKASATETGALFASTLERAGASFVPVTLTALGQVRAGIGDIEDDLERAFSASARFVEPLTDDFLAGAERAVEGFANAAERAGPAVDVLGEIGRRAGDVLGDTFEGLSEHAVEGSHALMALWSVFEFGIRSIAGTIEGLTIVYGWMEKFSAMARGDTAELARLVAEQEAAKGSSSGLSGGLQQLINGLTGTKQVTADATFEMQSFNDMIAELTGSALASERANIALEEAIDRAAEAAKDGADKGINPNTEAGRRNRTALLGIADAAQSASADIYKNTQSHELAAVATERGRKKFLEAADAMGVEKGEAIALANKLFGIPNVKREVEVKTKQTPIDLTTVAGRIAAIKSKSVVISVHNKITTTRSEGRTVGIGDGIGGRASGGPTYRGETYWVGEEGPELLTFRDNGYVLNAHQSADIARSAAASPGGRVPASSAPTTVRPQPAPLRYMSAGSGGMTVVHRTLQVTVNVPPAVNKAEVGREVVEAVKAYEKSNGRGWRTSP